MARPPVPARKPTPTPSPSPAPDDLGMSIMLKPFRQLGSDASVARNQMHAAMQTIKTGYQKVMDFMSGK